MKIKLQQVLSASLFRLTHTKKTEPHVIVADIQSADHMNPSQYLSKGGAPCAGSDGRYQVTFRFPDDTQAILSLSARQSAPLSKGMRGTLVYRGAVFLSFEAE